MTSQVKEAFDDLRNSSFEDRRRYDHLCRSFAALERNAFDGIQIPKRLIPKEYLRQGVMNLWKRNLAHGWRMLFSVENNDNGLVVLVLGWLPHKEYERLFHY